MDSGVIGQHAGEDLEAQVQQGIRGRSEFSCNRSNDRQLARRWADSLESPRISGSGWVGVAAG